MKCKRCDAEVADAEEATLAAAGWGWTLAQDFGFDANGLIPGYWYACPDCSDDDMKDAFSFVRRELAHGR